MEPADNIKSTDTMPNGDDINTVITRWNSYGSPKDAKFIYNYISPVINSAIQSFGNGDQSLRVKAYKLAFDAAKTYDSSKKADLKTYIYSNLQRLNRISAQRDNIIHIPEGYSKDYSVVGKAILEFQDKYNREPSEEELADITKLSPKRLYKILSGATPVSSSGAYSEVTGDAVTHKGISDDTYIDYLYASSDPIDKKIIELGSGHRGRPIIPGSEIARKLNITAPAVSQRIAKLRKRMAELKGIL